MNILNTLALSFRSWLKTPVVFVLAILMLAVGIGASVAAYGYLNAAFLQPLAAKNPDEIWRISRHAGGPMTPGHYYALVDHSPALSETFLARVHQGINLQVHDEAALVSACEVSGNYFQALRVSAMLGRAIRPEDDVAGADPVVVVSERLWRNRLGSREDLLGSPVQLNGRSATIIGIIPSSFRGTYRRDQIDVWFPHEQVFERWHHRHRALDAYTALLRVENEADVTQLQAELEIFAAHQQQEHPSQFGYVFGIKRERESAIQRSRNLATQTYFILGVLLTLLLIACANVSNILLAKVNSRRSELAIRRALGAPTRSIFGLLIADGMVLATVAGIAGVLFALLFLKGFALWGMELPPGETLNGRVLLFFVGVTFVVGLLCSVVPAIQAIRVNINEVLKESSRTSTRFRTGSALIAVQVAFSLTLLIGSGLFIRSLQEAQRVDTGLRGENILSFRLNLNNVGGSTIPGRIELYLRLLETFESDPDIVSAGISGYPLLQGSPSFAHMAASGVDIPPESHLWSVTRFIIGPGFFETMGIPIVKGRPVNRQEFIDRDHVAVINESLANRIWPGVDPIGQEFHPYTQDRDLTFRVVGVCRDFRVSVQSPPPAVYMYPLAVNESVFMVHTRVNPERMKPRVLSIVRELDPSLPIHDLWTIDESLAHSIQPIRAGFSIMLTVGFLGLAISVVGIYAALSYWVRRSSQEIGLRMALGASPSVIVWMYVRRGGLIVLAGLLLGCGLAAFAMPYAQDLLYQVEARDPVTFAVVPIVLFLAALLASFFSARHAAGVDPMVALRTE